MPPDYAQSIVKGTSIDRHSSQLPGEPRAGHDPQYQKLPTVK
jgi:hypothetical protein